MLRVGFSRAQSKRVHFHFPFVTNVHTSDDPVNNLKNGFEVSSALSFVQTRGKTRNDPLVSVSPSVPNLC